MIRLLRFPDEPHDRRHVNDGRSESIRSNLERYTRRTFKDAAQWEAWWSSEGHRTPLYVHEGVPVEERTQLTAAAVRWAREQSAPLLRGPVTYVYDYLEDEEKPLSTEAVRYYTLAEMRLLGRGWDAVGLPEFVSNGERAEVFMSGYQWRYTLELTRDGAEWKVVGAKSHPVQ